MSNAHSSKPNAHNSMPNAHNSMPNAHNSMPNAHSSMSNAHSSKPNAHNSKPNAHNSMPNAHNSMPNAHSSMSNAHSSMSNAHDIVIPTVYQAECYERCGEGCENRCNDLFSISRERQASTFPDIWKHAAIVPVPKVKGTIACNDLRPIFLTPLLARIFEMFFINWIIEDIETKLDSKQFGSRKGASTTHYPVSLIDSILKDTDGKQCYVNLCAVDFAKAFDRVDHSIVVNKLIEIGVRSSIIPIICSFLTNRVINTKF
ncbi:uncharacterized protein LOC117106743, partial [Anneissia japonica]|uniref:uncharacterized protein LOC117106743 n=1 Tax=Anneissia japonica TaxID=1529436 RepID=UPI0014257C04